MKKIILVISFLTLNFAQHSDLYKSRHIQKAYEIGTRSLTGNPGETYWINKADYFIRAELFPAKNTLKGVERIHYYNESPDTLSEIVFRLYNDFYKKGTARDWQIDSLALTNGVKLNKMMIRDRTIDLSENNNNVERNITNLIVYLTEPLPPSEKLEITVDWETKIPDVSKLRMGVYPDSAFFVAYWYPQVAVYDDIHGWDKLNYTGTTEMYNDFNNYEVSITAPDEFIVLGTGLFENPEDIFSQHILLKYKDAIKSDSTVNIISKEDLNKGDITLGTDKKVWKFKADKSPDFAFSAARNYLWDGSGLELESGKRIFVEAAYRENSEDFKDVVDIALKTIKIYSEEFPAVEFPFPTMTIFNGSGGMEFPMLINDGSTSGYDDAVGLTAHEIAHTYFPFLTGTNERRYAFMDEGMAVILTYYIKQKLLNYNEPLRSMARYKYYDDNAELVPPMVESAQLSGSAYRAAAYSRPALAYYFLEKLIGRDLFLESMRKFINTWKYKHPLPYDLFYTFNNVTGQNLNWYWQRWFFDFAHPDLGIKKYTREGGRRVVIENIGGLPLPVILNIYYKDGSEEKIEYLLDVWKEESETIEIKIENDKKITAIILGNDFIPDHNNGNNTLNLNEM